MKIKLTVTKGKATRDHVTLRLPAVIGRSKETDLTVVHPMVSRRHCELVEEDGLVIIRDLGSLNGTLLAGQKIQEGPLPPEAQFSVGPLAFSIEYEFAGDLSTLPPIIPAGFEAEDAVDGTPLEEPILEIEEEEKPHDGETDPIGATADTDGDLAPGGMVEEEVEEEDEEEIFSLADEAEAFDLAVDESPEDDSTAEPVEGNETGAETASDEEEAEAPLGLAGKALPEEAEISPVAEVASEEAAEPEESAPEDDGFDFLEEEETAKPIESASEAAASREESHEVDDDDVLDFLSDDDEEEGVQAKGKDDDTLDDFFKSLE